MKKFKLLFLFVSMTVLIVACKKGDTGPAGPAGPAGSAGPQGPIGIEGNANVTMYSFGSFDFAATANGTFVVPTTEDSMQKSAWYAYLVSPAKFYYEIPGSGSGGGSEYRTYWQFAAPSVSFYISRITGAGEMYDSVKIVRIMASKFQNEASGSGKSAQPPVDYSDFHSVAAHYHLRD